MEIGKKVKIVFDDFGKPIVYRGVITGNDFVFLTINDIYIGEVSIKISKIVKVEEWKQ